MKNTWGKTKTYKDKGSICGRYQWPNLFKITTRQISNSPDVEKGGKGGHVEGELCIAPV